MAKHKNINRYQVKWVDHKGVTHYGIYVMDQKEYKPPKGYAAVEDAILPVSHFVHKSMLVDLPCTFNGEYDKFVQAEYDKAQAISDKIKGKVAVGSMFSLPVGDGRACYVITKVAGKTCDVEWRGFSLDRWHDHYFGGGRRRVPVSEIKRYVHAPLFGRSR